MVEEVGIRTTEKPFRGRMLPIWLPLANLGETPPQPSAAKIVYARLTYCQIVCLGFLFNNVFQFLLSLPTLLARPNKNYSLKYPFCLSVVLVALILFLLLV